MNKNRELTPVRLSHLLRHCSVGSIVRGPDYLVTVKDIRDWTDRNGATAGRTILYVDGVRSALGIYQELREPPIAMELDKGLIDGVCIPAMRFPSWMRCPNPRCGLLYYRPWRTQTQRLPRCERCEKHPLLEQVPWVLVHPDGHMNDVSWHYLTHMNAKKQNQRQCGQDRNELYLRLVDEGASHRTLQCERCKVSNDFGDFIYLPYGMTGCQPWISDAPEATNALTGEKIELAVVLEINDARVHAPRTSNALIIPPESRIRKGTVVDRLYRNSLKRQQLDNAGNPLVRKALLNSIATEFRCSSGEIEDALREIVKGYPLYGASIASGHLFESEYKALLEEIPDVSEDEDFVTLHITKAWKNMSANLPSGERSRRIIGAVSQLVSVNRLTEILILKGFQRLGGKLVPPDIVGQSDWLPAIKLYGEGIFFTLEDEMLRKWETLPALQERATIFHRRYVNFGLQVDRDLQVSPRFLLLHTLAHLLIRQLETEAGYPAASLKERIYCSTGKTQMAGILVYVAVPDVAGSLGGLAELAEPRRFLSLLSSVFDHAGWCSFDPVCSEHEGQGPGLLNRAACHACTLVPETSCAYGNTLLDRGFIKGDVSADIPVFLNYVGGG